VLLELEEWTANASDGECEGFRFPVLEGRERCRELAFPVVEDLDGAE